jgi:hypothetical protein
LYGKDQRPHKQNLAVRRGNELVRQFWDCDDRQQDSETASGKKIVVRDQFVARSREEEVENTCQTDSQPHKDHRLNKDAHFAQR